MQLYSRHMNRMREHRLFGSILSKLAESLIFKVFLHLLRTASMANRFLPVCMDLYGCLELKVEIGRGNDNVGRELNRETAK